MNKILIIEDDADINVIIAEALTKAGYSCTQAFSGTEALLYLNKENYALAVMDLMLPGLSGEKLLPKLKEKQQIPVIVVSAKDSLDSKVNLLTEGAEDYLTKPFELEELIAREQHPAPKFWINPEIKNFYDFTVDDFRLDDYVTGPQIKNIPVAV